MATLILALPIANSEFPSSGILMGAAKRLREYLALTCDMSGGGGGDEGDCSDGEGDAAEDC